MVTNFDSVRKLALASIGVSGGVLVLKVIAWQITGAAALFSDAAESVVNVAAAIAAYVAVRIAERPADHNHPFGHHKAEYISAVFEGVLIILASLAVFNAAWDAFAEPRPLDAPLAGLATNALAGAINAGWGFLLVRQGRALHSPALVADGRHLLTDVISSLSVLIGLAIAVAADAYVLDAVLAAIVGAIILWAGWKLIKESLGGLMDEAISPETAAQIRDIIAKAGDGAIEMHDLRTRRAGRATFIEFHLVVDGDMTVAQSHAICDRLEEMLARKIKGSITTIHVEPDHKAKTVGATMIGPAD